MKTNFKIQISFLIVFFMLITSCQRGETIQKKATSTISIEEMSIPQLERAYKTKHFTVRQVVETYLQRIHNLDKKGPHLNSIIVINPDALMIADSLDNLLVKGQAKGALFGVSVILKDNIIRMIK